MSQASSPAAMSGARLRLLSLDGGGVRGLSSLHILKNLLQKVVGPGQPLPKPCEYFDMIAGTSTGGLIAIMLGRLEMTIDECIDAYQRLSKDVFGEKKTRGFVNRNLELKAQYDSAKLERVVKTFDGAEELLASPIEQHNKCKVVVFAVHQSHSQLALLRSYQSTDSAELAPHTTIWEACLATSAAPRYFDSIAIGPHEQELIDGGLGYNNPVEAMYAEAREIWGPNEAAFQQRLACLVSIGTGVPSFKAFDLNVRKVTKSVSKIVSDTETTADRFWGDHSDLVKNHQYFRFNVERGLQGIGLHEYEKLKLIVSVTSTYIDKPKVKSELLDCARALKRAVGPAFNASPGPTFARSSPSSVPFVDKFVDRPAEMKAMAVRLLPNPNDPTQVRRRIYVLHGMGGIGKTQLAANFITQHWKAFSTAFWLRGNSRSDLRRSLVQCAKRIPKEQISEKSRKGVAESPQEEEAIVDEVLAWLGREDNTGWLLVFDNVDLDTNLKRDIDAGAYNVLDYLPSTHGSVLITTRLSKLAQLGGDEFGETGLCPVGIEMSRMIFEKWYGSSNLSVLGPDAAQSVEDLVGNKWLDGLPLAIAQAASYMKATGIPISEYKRRYLKKWDYVMEFAGKKTPVEGYHKSVGTTWSLSLQQVEETCPSAGALVRTWAFLDHKDFWYGLVADVQLDKDLLDFFGAEVSADDRRGKNKATPLSAWLRDAAQNEGEFLQCIEALLDFGLVEPNRLPAEGLHDEADAAGLGYSMHPVVHTWAMQMQTEDERMVSLRDAIRLFSGRSEDNARAWHVTQRWLPHASKLDEWTASLRTEDWRLFSVVEVESLRRLFGVFYDAGLWEEASVGVALLSKAVRCEETELETEEQLGAACDGPVAVPWFVVWLILTNQAVNLINFGHFLQAEAKIQEALQLLTRVGDAATRVRISTLHRLTMLHNMMGNLEKCEEALDEAFWLLDLAPAGGWPALEIILTMSRGELFFKRHDYLDAEKDLLKGLEMARDAASQEQENRAQYFLGRLYNIMGRYAEAEKFLERMLDSELKRFGPTSIHVVRAAHLLGRSYIKQHKFDEATKILTLAFGSSSPDGLVEALGLLRFYCDVMRERSEDVSRIPQMVDQAWDATSRVLGPLIHKKPRVQNVEHLKQALNWLRSICEEQGRADRARQLDEWLGMINGSDVGEQNSDQLGL